MGSLTRRTALLVLLTLGLAAALPAAPAEPAPAAAAVDEKCAPPCGYIWPTIGLHADIAPDALVTSKIGELPTSIPIRVTYSWDMEQDLTGLPGDAEEMKITMMITKKPVWLGAQIVPSVCTFRLIPVQNEYEVCTVELQLKVDPAWVPANETDLETYGKRLMVFGASEESGTFKKSYGIEEFRWTFDAAPTIDGMVARPETVAEESPLVAPVALVAALAALAVLRRRRF